MPCLQLFRNDMMASILTLTDSFSCWFRHYHQISRTIFRSGILFILGRKKLWVFIRSFLRPTPSPTSSVQNLAAGNYARKSAPRNPVSARLRVHRRKHFESQPSFFLNQRLRGDEGSFVHHIGFLLCFPMLLSFRPWWSGTRFQH